MNCELFAAKITLWQYALVYGPVLIIKCCSAEEAVGEEEEGEMT